MHTTHFLSKEHHFLDAFPFTNSAHGWHPFEDAFLKAALCLSRSPQYEAVMNFREGWGTRTRYVSYPCTSTLLGLCFIDINNGYQP